METAEEKDKILFDIDDIINDCITSEEDLRHATNKIYNLYIVPKSKQIEDLQKEVDELRKDRKEQSISHLNTADLLAKSILEVTQLEAKVKELEVDKKQYFHALQQPCDTCGCG